MPGLYIHIPFCVKKCKYCDFVSFDTCPEYKDKYVSALIRQIEENRGYKCDTIFIGGGTPTALSAGQLEKVLCAVRNNFDIDHDAEFSTEANPGTVTKEKLAVMKKYGINRVSLGVQSFNDAELAGIGRIHTARQAEETVRLLRESGFDNINLDLMTALPDQSAASLKNTLKRAVSLDPEHLSCYSLILEEGTPLYKAYVNGEFETAGDDEDREMYRYTCGFLQNAGYNQYEISNFAKPGYECRHNICYWTCGEYLGLGLAAHSYINGVRFYNTSDLNRYEAGNFVESDRLELSQDDKIAEFMMLGLRMTRGVDENEFMRRFGIKIDEKFAFDKFISGGFMMHENGRYFFTPKGIDVSNSILCEFV